MLKRFQTPLAGATEAKVVYQDGDYQVLKHGTFVKCAVTNDPIDLEDLRYWSVERQEAYKTADISLKRHLDLQQK